MNAVVHPASPLPAPVSGFTFALRLAKAIVVSAALFLLGNYTVNLILSQVSKEPVREHLRQAFTNGDLGIVGSRALDSDMGVHQVNDCLIFDMAAHDAGDNWLYYLFAASLVTEKSARGRGQERCEQVRNWVFNDPIVTSR